MSNPFDQFDSSPPVAVQAAPAENPFDKFDSHGTPGADIQVQDDKLTDIGETIPSTGATLSVKDVPGMVADMGATGVGIALGQMAGGAVPGFEEITVPAGGFVGGLAGDAAGQVRRMANGTQSGFKWGEWLGSGASGLIPGGSLTAAAEKEMAKRAMLYGATNLAAKNMQTQIDQGRAPTLGEATLATATGAAAPFLAKAVDTGGTGPAIQAAKDLKAVRDASIAEGREAGYTVPAYDTNPSKLNKSLGSMAGKAASGQQSAINNQDITNELAAKALGLPTGNPITASAIQAVRDDAGKAYQAVADLSPNAAADLEALKQARFDANAYSKFYSRSGDPAALKKAQSLADTADALEARVETHARAYDNWVQAGKPQGSAASDWAKAEASMAKKPAPNGLVQDLRAARTKIAKSYVVENALNEATGDVSASDIGKLFAKNPKLLTGELATIGKFQQAVPVAFTRDATKVSGPGVNNLRSWISNGTGGLGGAIGYHSGGLEGAALGAAAGKFIPGALEGPARSLLLSRGYQNSAFAAPFYGTARPDFQALLARYGTMAGGRMPDQTQIQAMLQGQPIPNSP